MSKRVLLSAGLALITSLAALAALPAAAAVSMRILGADAGRPEAGLLHRVDARDYHHCHNMPRRIRCHRRNSLPVNWPPNSNTPGTSSPRHLHVKRATCRHPKRWQVR
jgi:hypothetical protein